MTKKEVSYSACYEVVKTIANKTISFVKLLKHPASVFIRITHLTFWNTSLYTTFSVYPLSSSFDKFAINIFMPSLERTLESTTYS